MTISRNLSILAEGVNSSGVLAATNGGTGVTTSTGSGSNVLSASPTFSGTITFPGSTTIDSSGNVGIGTSSPATKLQLESNTTAQIRTGYVTGGATAYYDFGRDSADGYFGFNGAQSSPFVGYKWKINGTEAMRIDSSGNVGVGTTVTSNKLNVYGSIGTYYDPVTYPAIRGYISHTGNTGGFQINAQGANNSTFGAGNITFWTPSANSANGSTDATLTEKMRIDSSGNVGIGTASPSRQLSISNATQSNIQLTNTAAGSTITDGFQLQFDGSYNYVWGYENVPTVFGTNNSERARIDSSGNLLVGTTSESGKLTVSGGGNTFYATQTSASSYTGIFNALNNSGTYYLVAWQANGTTVGSINSNGTTTNYATSSDYRLKENIAPMTNGLATIGALKPVIYNWVSDKSQGEGFIAHELQEVIPLAVSGEKDAVDDEGNIKPQGVDYSKLVVHLVAAIQELSAKNDALEARLAALETP